MVSRVCSLRAVRLLTPACLLCVLLAAGCAVNPYIKSHQQYFSGDPAAAEQTLTLEAQKEATKDGKWKNLYLWDLGIYQFNQGKYKEAIDSFKASVLDRERMYGTGETVKTVALKSSSSSKYLGDPVEVSVAYLYLGFSYLLRGDLENCLVAFRRSTEEDLSEDEQRIGDMAITNYMMGECYLRTQQPDDAIVAFRRALASSPDFVPAYIGMLHAAGQNKDLSTQEFARAEMAKRLSPEYLAQLDSQSSQGIVVVLANDVPDFVSKDMWVGMFRKREEVASNIGRWQLRIEQAVTPVAMSQADHMHTHFKDQGGFQGETTRQLAKAAMGQGLKRLGLGFLAPNTDADIRYWSTMPGRFHVGYLPIAPGTYNVSLQCFDKKDKEFTTLGRQWSGVVVQDGQRAILIANSFVKADTKQISVSN